MSRVGTCEICGAAMHHHRLYGYKCTPACEDRKSLVRLADFVEETEPGESIRGISAGEQAGAYLRRVAGYGGA